jgi:hypothetical protein
VSDCTHIPISQSLIQSKPHNNLYHRGRWELTTRSLFFAFNRYLSNSEHIRVASIIAIVAFGLLLAIFFNIPKVSAMSSTVCPNSTIPIQAFCNLPTQSSGYGPFSNLPPGGYVIGSSNSGSVPTTQPSLPTNSIANTPFGPLAGYGQFSNSNGGSTSVPTTQPSLPTNSIANTPFGPLAGYGQFSNSNGGSSSLTQNPYSQQFGSPLNSGQTQTQGDPYSYQQNNPYSYPGYQSSSTPGSSNALSSYPYQSQYPPGAMQNQFSPFSNGTSSSYPSAQFVGQAQPQQNQTNIQTLANDTLNKPTQSQSINDNATNKSNISTLVVRTVTSAKPTGVGAAAQSTKSLDPPMSNITEIVQNVYTTPDGYTSVYHYAKGSPAGVTFNLRPGSFSVSEMNSNKGTGIGSTSHITNPSYAVSFTGDCHTNNANVKSQPALTNTPKSIYGIGTLKLGETKSCVITHTPISILTPTTTTISK